MPSVDYDSHVFLHNISWNDYERLLEMRGEKSMPRISYLEGEVELIRPSKDHESITSYIGRLLEAWCTDREIDFTPLRSWTLKDKLQDAGAEPDECYIFGPTKAGSRPHLAIEVEWTHGGIDKLSVYEKLGVEEVWFWSKGVIKVFILTKGKFTSTVRSKLFPDLDLELLASMLDRDSLSQAVRDFRKALQQRES